MTSPVPDAHLAAQAALASRLTPVVAETVAAVKVDDLAASLPKVSKVVQALQRRYGRASQALALAQYRRLRLEAGLPAQVRLDLPAPVAVKVDEAVQWAFRDLWGPLNDEPATVDGKLYQPVADRLADAETNLQGVTDKLVADQGRDATFSFVKQDRQARGWARVPEPNCCAWCALLATRGAVYKEDTIKFNAGGRFIDTDEFGGHNHCRCQPLPVFTTYEKSAQILEWESLYSESEQLRQSQHPVSYRTAEPLSGLALFRRLYEASQAPPQ